MTTASATETPTPASETHTGPAGPLQPRYAKRRAPGSPIEATPLDTKTPLRTLWLGAGWLGVAIVTWFSLIPNPPGIDIEEGDKVQHLVAYASLMLWFAQAQTSRAQRRVTALLLVALGVALELGQGLTGYRSLSIADMAANTAGVGLGSLAAPPRLPNGFAWLSDRLNRACKTR